MLEKFLWVAQAVIRCVAQAVIRWVVGWIIESLCLPTEAFRDLSVTFMVLVKVKVRLR